MKIAQITLYGYHNYGNILQKFALQHTLKKLSLARALIKIGASSILRHELPTNWKICAAVNMSKAKLATFIGKLKTRSSRQVFYSVARPVNASVLNIFSARTTTIF